MDDDEIFDLIFDSDGEGSVPMTWEIARRCTTPRAGGGECYSTDTKQPNWDCPDCGGLGALFAEPVEIVGLFRSQSKWRRTDMAGQSTMGEAQLTTPLDVRPQWEDDRIKDRFTVLINVDDITAGTTFTPAAKPVPFNFAGEQRAWRVMLQSLEQTNRTRPQP